MPRRGDFIETVGFPLSDNFHLTLLHTKWRTLASTPGKGAKAMITVPIPCEVKTR